MMTAVDGPGDNAPQTRTQAAPGDDPAPGAREIVVGVDGSENSRQALLWARGQARLTGAGLHAVSVWTTQVTANTAFGVPEMPPPDYSPEQATRADIEDFLTEALGTARTDVRLSVLPGPAGQALVEAAREADLLVVGSHGHSTLRDVLLGSTTEHCIHHATCPVLVLRTANT